MVISDVIVKNPRRPRCCAVCHRPMPVGAPQRRLYGAAERGDKPYRVYVHIECPKETTS